MALTAVPGIPIKLSDTPGSIHSPAPLLGQHNEEILREWLGLSAAEIADLNARGM